MYNFITPSFDNILILEPELEPQFYKALIIKERWTEGLLTQDTLPRHNSLHVQFADSSVSSPSPLFGNVFRSCSPFLQNEHANGAKASAMTANFESGIPPSKT